MAWWWVPLYLREVLLQGKCIVDFDGKYVLMGVYDD